MAPNIFQTARTVRQGPSVGTGDKPDTRPWIEKYRPRDMNEISSQDEVVAVLKKTMESQNLPHLLFYGPPGTGKTSTVLALAKELYGPDIIRDRVLELNASDERGIDVIRAKVKNFAKVTVTQTSVGFPCPPYKIIILDEADSMTQDAQSALRRTMETYSKSTRFCLICNYISRIIEPLASRCAKFRFKPLDTDSTRARIEYICQNEGVNAPPETVQTLVKLADGDMRRSIMLLQSAFRLYQKELITSAAICEIAGVVPESVIDGLVTAWQSRDIAQIETAVERVVRQGYSGAQLMDQLQERVLADNHLTSIEKSKISISIGQMDKALVDGADEQLQLLSLFVNAY
ncbi:P-loop containing nucleoside triphosphate hydrolase protein [Fimicolochytrium jonesii]|uniref:P-loop containing nucleoside triphosphate hydrolase protein n=1 Tax=Fimicolochytrium jonesii TaxID=1396493 RepID=UPI0022FE42A7|nr:P-loop containing nucleoside triphosphate hydrolase protein [Fimicolochytrium jonesii]KAI8816311.1 P-loop containing nucleoside triphosphate hydrolase protein [Fimicolochytrium jonesii]